MEKEKKNQQRERERKRVCVKRKFELWLLCDYKNKYIIYNSKPFLMSLLKKMLIFYIFMCAECNYEMNEYPLHNFFFRIKIALKKYIRNSKIRDTEWEKKNVNEAKIK